MQRHQHEKLKHSAPPAKADSDPQPASTVSKRRRRRRKSKTPADGRSTNLVVAALDQPSQLSHEGPTDAPLNSAEIAEMSEHLGFLARHRKLLRIKPNASEDLLLNGNRKPTHRGVCKHLLAKVDRSSVESALARLESAEAKATLLAGIIRFSQDISFILLYLENIQAFAEHHETAAALTLGLRRIDFQQASAAQIRRTLELIAEIFSASERTALLFELLQSHSFRQAFDDSSEQLPKGLGDIFLPIRAAYDCMVANVAPNYSHEHLRDGLHLLLGTQPRALLAYEPPVKRRLFELGLLCADFNIVHKPLATLLASFSPESRAYSSMAMSYARKLMQHHKDKEAEALLGEVCQHHPSFQQPKLWHKALNAPRIDRFALLHQPTSGPAPSEGVPSPATLQPAFWLDRQNSVWLRVSGASPQGDNCDLAAEAEIHRQLYCQGVAPLLSYSSNALVVLADGQLASHALSSQGGSPTMLCRWSHQALCTLAMLAHRRLVLPDVGLHRWVLTQGNTLVLANLSGARQTKDDEAETRNVALGQALFQEILRYSTSTPLPLELNALAQSACGLEERIEKLLPWL